MTGTEMATPGVAVVTGAASGIGAAIAAELSDRGWRVAGLDMRPSGWHLGIEADVSDAGAVDAAVARVQDELGPVDAVVSAAGHYEIVPVAQISLESWTRMLRVHLGGLLNLSRAVLPGMVDRGSGSDRRDHLRARHRWRERGLPLRSRQGRGHRAGPQSGRRGGAARRPGQRGRPGPTDTPLLPADSPWRDPSYLATLPLGRLAAPEEIALTVAFLVEDGTFCSGEVISPNSGAVI